MPNKRYRERKDWGFACFAILGCGGILSKADEVEEPDGCEQGETDSECGVRLHYGVDLSNSLGSRNEAGSGDYGEFFRKC